MTEYKSFFKTVGGNEGSKCKYSTRLDVYGKGCQHDCSYCYAKSLLSFRGLWDAEHPAEADLEKVRRKISKLPRGTIIRMGGMTDCFQPLELRRRLAYETIKILNEYGIGYLIVTKSRIIADDKYMDVMDKGLAHIQVTVTTLDDDLYIRKNFERASLPSHRAAAIHKLEDAGFDVAIRLSPLIPEYMDFEQLAAEGFQKAIVEFLRVNSWIKKWFSDIDYSDYTLREGNYWHLPLEKKIDLLDQIMVPTVSVCEDVTEHYEYWKKLNPNPDDCCNLRRSEENVRKSD